MSYDVYWVKNRAEKIADFEHPTLQGVLLIAIIPRAMPWARSFLGFQPASTDTKVPAKRCILLFTLQKACYTRSVCLSRVCS